MNVSLKNRFRPTLDALEDRSLPSTGLGLGLIHHHAHPVHPAHPVHHAHQHTRIEVHHHRHHGHGQGEQAHSGADDHGGAGEVEIHNGGAGEVEHGGGHA